MEQVVIGQGDRHRETPLSLRLGPLREAVEDRAEAAGVPVRRFILNAVAEKLNGWDEYGGEMTAQALEQDAAADTSLTAVITLRSGAQLRFGVERAAVQRNLSGDLVDIRLTDDGDPLGDRLGYLDLSQVVVIHYERASR